ncbi:conjugal transfer protein TraU [Massilia sp. NR 4-1]|uniref:conjugal transfer protein TraU n=1 Tax=Massilia sp. NR 4-1 TaxID=1678028 RepID=UPI00067C65D8|nr:conjugal transfer protein TraU [Massilia sp. NR 4-1]AKU21209.1 conjugal transfer protein TraU [Massilia sp. NR 4-1]
MAILENSINAVEDVLAYLARYMIGRDLASYCELTTAIGLTDEDLRRNPELRCPYTLVSDANELLTVFELQGSYQILSPEEFAELIENLRIRLNGYLRRYGHSLTFGFERDPERAIDELMRLVEPQINTARRTGLRTEDIILDRVRRNAPLVVWEQNLLVVYTHLNIMADEERKAELKKRSAEAVKHQLPRLAFAQSPASILISMKYRHDTMLERLKFDFEHCGPEGRPGILLRQLSVDEAVRSVRIMVNRERTSQKFRPVLLGQAITPHGREDPHDVSDLAAPLLSYQICANDCTTLGGLVETDGLFHGTLTMELGPQDMQAFSALLESLARDIPWRIRFDLCPGGLDEMRGRTLLTTFVGMLPANKEIRQSLLDLKERNKRDAILSLKVALSTWASSQQEVRRHMATLEKAIQAWGTCQVTSSHGDPVAAWCSSIPAFTHKNVANRQVPPLPDALAMLPFERPATPFADCGNMHMRTPDGKIYSIQLGSRLQDTWIELLAGTPGSGKSGMLNTMAMATVHTAGATRLPLYTTVEVGASAIGLIDIIRDSLPPGRKSEAIYLQLENSQQYMVNLFDTQLGARFPTQQERDFQIDFLNLLCTDPSTRQVPSDCARANEMLVDIAYEDRCNHSPHLYEPQVCAEVDRVLESSGLLAAHDAVWWESTTWWEVTDLLFKAGHPRIASIAQRYAVPVLPDFNAYLHNESIRHLFGDAQINGNGEHVLSYMDRCLAVASNTYALFQGRTRFELDSNTRVVAVNLNNVIGTKSAEGELRTAAMFMFGRFLAARHYFIRETTLLPVVPPEYRNYHLQRIADVKQEQKVLVYDESHNAGGYEPFIETLIKDGREGRKWGIRVVASSQYLSDQPQRLRAAATTIFLMRGGNTQDEQILQQEFPISRQAIVRLRREAVGPGPEGVNYLALFKTKIGFIAQILTNTAGPIELWAFSTTLQDVALRDLLAERIGSSAARIMLARRFPSGTALPTIDRMRADAAGNDTSSAIEKLANTLADEFLNST